MHQASGSTFDTTRIGGAGNVNLKAENGLVGPTARVGGKEEEAQAAVERIWQI